MCFYVLFNTSGFMAHIVWYSKNIETQIEQRLVVYLKTRWLYLYGQKVRLNSDSLKCKWDLYKRIAE